jgi:hypothetical protein
MQRIDEVNGEVRTIEGRLLNQQVSLPEPDGPLSSKKGTPEQNV